ncbi:hypothetical protein RRF57_009474 [Xylaria bambusicola]|uniref:Uncharacterized protein n=1 Tax=Xylaria bambusicola TaxID=326684 RepID=A0AAN7UJP5_9PEZI
MHIEHMFVWLGERLDVLGHHGGSEKQEEIERGLQHATAVAGEAAHKQTENEKSRVRRVQHHDHQAKMGVSGHKTFD